jgi:hypothetical protein
VQHTFLMPGDGEDSCAIYIESWLANLIKRVGTFILSVQSIYIVNSRFTSMEVGKGKQNKKKKLNRDYGSSKLWYRWITVKKRLGLLV